MSNFAISEDVAKKLLDKWGITNCCKLELRIIMEPDAVVKMTVIKYLTTSEVDDITEALQEYHLVKNE